MIENSPSDGKMIRFQSRKRLYCYSWLNTRPILRERPVQCSVVSIDLTTIKPFFFFMWLDQIIRTQTSKEASLGGLAFENHHTMCRLSTPRDFTKVNPVNYVKLSTIFLTLLRVDFDSSVSNNSLVKQMSSVHQEKNAGRKCIQPTWCSQPLIYIEKSCED